MMWDDFYHEPSEFDEQVEEFKESLRASVKEEVKQEMERLREENASLREIRDHWNAKVQELDKKMQAAELAAKEAKRLRLKELLAEHSVFAYSIHTEYITQPKCDLCDQYRNVQYTTPLGRIAKEECRCKETRRRYHVKKVPIVSISENCRDVIVTKYLINERADEGYLRYADCFYDETPFEKIGDWKPLFHSENRARRYAAWKNKKEGW